MLEYMQNRCDNTGNLTKKDTKRKLQEKVMRITTSSCQRLKKRKGEKSGTGSTGLQTSIYLLFEDVN